MSTHREIAALLQGDGGLPNLVDAWRAERTSELAEAITIVGQSEHVPARLDDDAGIDLWCATWRSDLAGALEELVRRRDRARYDPSWTFDTAATDARAAEWAKLSRCVAALREAEPDPRIGRTVENMIADSAATDWFRPDQVAHMIIGRPAKEKDDPSFADHALALLETHADGGTAARLRHRAERMLVEASCDEVEMSERLRALAETLQRRYPRDLVLVESVASALRARHAR